MATIGTFKKTKDGFTGTIETLTLKAKVSITPAKKNGDKAPDFRVYVGNSEIGAGWSRKSENGNDYVSVKLDDPIFAQVVYANLVGRDDTYDLLWSR